MNISYAIIVASAILSSVITILVMPVQEQGIAMRLEQKEKEKWQEAVNACKQAVDTPSITATNSDGVNYCISYAGKVLATITENKKP